jgi:hypothetical protein
MGPIVYVSVVYSNTDRIPDLVVRAFLNCGFNERKYKLGDMTLKELISTGPDGISYIINEYPDKATYIGPLDDFGKSALRMLIDGTPHRVLKDALGNKFRMPDW